MERKFAVPATSNMTVAGLKQALCDHLDSLRQGASEDTSKAPLPPSITAHNQRMIYCGKELPDSKVLDFEKKHWLTGTE